MSTLPPASPASQLNRVCAWLLLGLSVLTALWSVGQLGAALAMDHYGAQQWLASHGLMTSGLLGWVFKDSSPLFATAGEAALGVPLFGKGAAIKDLQAVACLPLNINRITRGVLCLAHDKPAVISQEMKNFLYMASDHLTLFLENLYFKSKLQQRQTGASTPEA